MDGAFVTFSPEVSVVRRQARAATVATLTGPVSDSVSDTPDTPGPLRDSDSELQRRKQEVQSLIRKIREERKKLDKNDRLYWMKMDTLRVMLAGAEAL